MQASELNFEYYLNTDLSSYIGEWVALCENKIVAHGKDLKVVVNEAKKICGNKKFLLSKVPSEETMIF